ncbi:MAG: IS1595 family transposase [Candidatus Binatia bacterium]
MARKQRKQMPEVKYEMNLVALVERFHCEDKCRAYLESLRWPDGPVCPRCECKSVSRIEGRGQYDCNSCRYQFSVTAGTVMHDSKLPLWKWFLTAYMMIESKKAVSANQVKRMIEVSYKTAWYLCHRIRSAMGEACKTPLTGTIEADETFVGGKVSGKGRGYTGNKAVVAGAAQRGGEVRLKVIPDRTRKALHDFLQNAIDRGETDALYTDDWEAYKGFADGNFDHQTINHSLEQWVRGEVHTNSVEGVWSLLKRAIMGAYHKISHKHLDAYLNELEWRFSNRRNPFLFRDTIKQLMNAKTMEYKKLIAG